MKKNRAAWDERFGWMWYGSDVVYNWTDEDFDRAAKSFADAHFTTVILFGTHFRFSYWAYWEDIENAIAKITKAFHKYGIKVVEHHSSHLTYRIDDEAGGTASQLSATTTLDFRSFAKHLRPTLFSAELTWMTLPRSTAAPVGLL